MTGEEKPSVYLETSFISYVTNRLSNDLLVAAHQKLSREWWEERRLGFSLFVSELVFQEATKGNKEAVEQRKSLLSGITSLPVTEDAAELAVYFLEQKAIPEVAIADGLHMAVAAVNKVDYLLSWNCKHIVNAAVRKKVITLCTNKGLQCPTICTPFELYEDESYE